MLAHSTSWPVPGADAEGPVRVSGRGHGCGGPGVGAYGGGVEEGPGGTGVPLGGPSLSSRNVAFVVSQTRLLGKGL
jgi:hypothetical protein